MAKKKANRKKKGGKSGNGQITTVSGNGGYISDLAKQIGKHVFAAVKSATPPGTFANLGTAGGAYFGHPVAGRMLGSGISKLLGWGAYEVRANSLMGKNLDEGAQIPSFGNLTHSTRVRHREFIRDITAVGGTTFTNLSFPINAGLKTTFPWLAKVAAAFEQYRVHGMVFEFRSTCSDISAGGALGSVVMATDYDAADSAYNNKLHMENAQYSTSAKPSVSFVHCVECAPEASAQHRLHYVRSAAVGSNVDPRVYDLGIFQIATVGLPFSSGNIGELWVTYDVELFKPSITENVTLADHFNLGTGISTSAYLDTSGVAVAAASGSTLGGTINTSTYTFPANVGSGKYLLVYQVYGASTTLTNGMSYTLGGCSASSLFNQTGTDRPYFNVVSGAASDTQIIGICVTLTAFSATVLLTSGTLPGTRTGGDLTVLELPADIA